MEQPLSDLALPAPEPVQPDPTRPPGEAGRRARKKQRTRDAIADAAAGLFAVHGYDAVTVADVARRADVSEQTVYNHFPTKEHLVFDRADEMISSLLARIRHRAPDETVLDAVRTRGLEIADVLGGLSSVPHHGGMPYLAATSPALGRHLNDLYVRNAAELAVLLAEEQGRPATDLAVQVQALALLAPSHAFIRQLGRGLAEGGETASVATALRPELEAAFDRLGEGLGEPRASEP